MKETEMAEVKTSLRVVKEKMAKRIADELFVDPAWVDEMLLGVEVKDVQVDVNSVVVYVQIGARLARLEIEVKGYY